MIWLTWRQLRVPALAVFGALGALAAGLALTGPALYREHAELLAGCGGAFCPDAFDHFLFGHLGAQLGLTALVIALPGVLGAFWGAPLIGRELETGTQDLVWQQSVPRRRWLAVKLGVVVLGAIAAAGLTVLAVSWWSFPLDATSTYLTPRLSPVLFDARGFAVVGYAAFAVTLGAAAGLLIRRTVPAMAVTLAIFVAVQVIVPALVRPHFAAPARLAVAITARNLSGVDASGPGGTVRGLRVDNELPGAWILASETVDSAGRTATTLPAWVADCATPEAPSGEITQRQCLDRLAAAGYRQLVTYHPPDRFWPFQAYETAIFGLLSLLLAGLCFVRIRPR
jgi:hypothetical protein